MIVNASLGSEPNLGAPPEQQSNDANQTQFDLWAMEVVHTVYIYYTPLLIVLGAIGNLASVFVFYSSKLRLQSTSQYLSALALSDTVFLLQLLPPWLSDAQIASLFHRGGFCQIFVYLSYVSCCMSAWLVVAFTIERFVAVLYPLRRNAMCTVARARHIIICLAIASIVLNLPVLRFAIPGNDDCNIDRDYLEHAARFNVVDTIITFTIPLAGIIVLNAWIMVGVCRLERARRQLVKAEPPGRGARARRSRPAAGPRSQQRVTRMLLIVSSVFVVLNLPAYTMRVLAYAHDAITDEFEGRWTALEQILVMFFDTNFGINFILYCLSGQKFRRALIQAVPCLRSRNRRAVAVHRAIANPARASSVSSLSGASYVSNCTEATTNCAVATVAQESRPRPRHFITRWTFDNSRQRAATAPGTSVIHSTDMEAVEMRALGGM